MKYYFLFLLNILSISGYAQNLSEDPSYNKWLHAIINIEVRTNQIGMLDEYLRDATLSGKISKEEYRRKTDSMLYLPPISWTGTAIFIEDKGYHFLLTARHVLARSSYSQTDTNRIADKILLIENDALVNKKTFVDTFDNILDTLNESIFLTGLSAGVVQLNPYLFTDIADDLGIICLDSDHFGSLFYHALNNRGFKPLHITDIDTTFSPKDGSKILSIGFPENSIVYRKKYFDVWQSEIVSVPVITKGIFTKEYPAHSNFFDAMMFVYHGFSGAPVICNGKIIGVVSGGEQNEFFETGDVSPFKYLIENHSKFVKSTLIVSLLRSIESKVGFIKRYLK